MRIKRKLPPVPRPATKPQIHKNLYGEGIWIHEVKPQIPSHMDLHEKSAAARARQTGEAEKRHDMLARLARDGLSDIEIAERTGYKPDSVRRLISKMRREGRNIPERKRGQKANDESN
jgi:DNA-binding NarL/FixJ family response regulator